ncbi:zinc finger and BTB domain-containing protein 38-like [Xyrauchen texanus]|uniref:zinc finger and BTB domain-containing protein 38-like n=1 Tax=Xyrauchen texanus TaxID=154827 RepID=UPI002242B623|nr:zinc finger and BTB domain-containing protein 38-like [Xyrauchen texanus]
MKHRNKQMRGDRMGEGTDEVDSANTTRISLSFPISAGLPGFSAQKLCSSSHPSSSSDVLRDGSDGTAWVGESFKDKQLSKTPPKTERLHCSSSSSSSSFPVDLTAPVSKKCKSSLSFSVDGRGSQYPTSPLQHSNKIDHSKETAGVSLNNGYKEHSTTETAHILFNLSARAYQDQGIKDPECSKGKKRKANSLHVELSLPLPSIDPHSSSSTPPPSPSSVSLTSSPLTLPTPSFHDSFRPVPKPELLCGVCHRLFSTASSLTVHMRLHRGGRVLSCHHCGKAFIHNKRLQSHEATCRQGLPAFSVQPKEEPLEAGEVEGERAHEGAEPEQLGQGTRPGRPLKKVQDVNGLRAETLTCPDGLGEDDHFVKVVDGHIIYFCSVCERSYMTLSSLKRHSNVHSWHRKYPCHYCDKVFALAEYRTKHEVWHTGERRYQCIFCWEAFPTYYNLKTHQKAFHGINPGLISSEKTVNGGYKQKVNALKLYRLLPMRSLKRPYKTYSQPMADGLLTSDSSVTLPLSLDGSLQPPLDTKKLESFLKDLQTPDINTEQEGIPMRVGVEQGKKLDAAQTDMAVEARETEGSDVLSGSNNGKDKTPKSPEGSVSSVIAFAHSKPSVIMHSTAVSSVIVHRNKMPTEERKKNQENHPMIKTAQKQIKKHSQRDHIDTYREWDTGNLDKEVSKIRQPTEKLHKGRKAHSKTESTRAISTTVGSEVKGSGPLCQITVRIGEEAIVKRSISETDLMRVKSPTLCKAKKSNLLLKDQREQRHTHHHQHKHHNFSQEGKEGERKRKNPKLKRKVRKYLFRQEVREDRKDHDVEDNLWRPYYSYKPKRKTLHMQGAKAWKRKMHYKQSLRPMKRAERLVKNLNKEVDGEDADERVGGRKEVNKEQREVSNLQKGQVKQTPQTFPVPSRTKKEKENGTEGKPDLPLPLSVPQTTLSPQYTVSSIIKQRWSEGQASECGTCGRWFSSQRKRDKHELTHLFEFVCMICRAPFPSQSKLEEHQRTQHPKNKPLSVPTFPTSQTLRNELEMKADENGVNGRSIEKGSPVHLGRRPLIRYTCSQCDKVCKTSAALNCHLKRHELGSLTELKITEQKQDTPSCTLSAAETAKSKDLDTNSEQVQPVSVIYYSKPDSKITDNQLDEKMDEHQRVSNCESPKLATNDNVNSLLCTQFSQVTHSSTLESFKTIPSNLPSVLVKNGAESLDYRTPEKLNLDTQDQQKRSATPSDRQIQVSQILTDTQFRRETTPSGPISLKTGRGCLFSQGIGTATQREGGIILNEDNCDSQDAQDLRTFPHSHQAQDLSMPKIKKKRELDQQITLPSNILKEQSRYEDVSFLVPKEEPLSPVPSPTCSVIQTTPKRPSQRYSTSPCHSPGPLDLQLRPQLEQSQSHRGRHNTEKQGLMLPANSAGVSDPPSSHTMLHPQVTMEETESKDHTSFTHKEYHRGSGYPVQELTLPLIIPGGYCSGKNQEEQILMSYPTGPLPFPPLGKMLPYSDSTKLPFYPDPYHLLYGPQLLPYPYNLAALPMALNMMADKEPLPFMPFFNYAATAAPLTGTVPHPLVVNPNLFNSGGSSSTKQDNS